MQRIDYDENPIIIKDKEFKVLVFIFIFCAPISIYLFDISSIDEIKVGLIVSIVLVYEFIKNFIKQRNSYFYFTNYQIFQKDKNEVFKEFKISDIKSIKKSYKGFKDTKMLSKNKILAWIRDSAMFKIVFVLICIYLICSITYLSVIKSNYSHIYNLIYLIIFILGCIFGIYFMFRLIDGLNLDILKNNVCIETDKDSIVLINLTKKEFDELEQYFKNFGLELKD